MDTLWRWTAGSLLAFATAYVAVQVVLNPTKRLIEALLGIGFIGLGLQASAVALIGFATVTIPYPMHTSVGSTTSLLILGVGALSVANSRRYGPAHPFVDRRLDVALIAFLVMTVLSLWHLAPVEGAGAMAWGRYSGLASAVVLYYLIIGRVKNERDVHRLLRISMVAASTVALIGALQTLFPGRAWLPPIFRFAQKMAELEEVTRGTYRSYASFPGISPFGQFASTSIVFMYFLIRRAPSLAEKTFWTTSIVLFLIAIAGSATRMAVLTTVFGFGYIYLFGSRTVPRWQILNLAFITIALLVLSYSFVAPLTALLEQRLVGLGSTDSSAMSRWGVMTQAFLAIPEHPLIGHGIVTPPGTFRGGVTMNIHCLYLTIPYMFGIPALIAFLMYAARLMSWSYRWMTDPRVPRGMRELLLALHTGAAMTLFHEMTGEFVTHAQSMHAVWFRFGLLVAATETARRAARAVASAEAGGGRA